MTELVNISSSCWWRRQFPSSKAKCSFLSCSSEIFLPLMFWRICLDCKFTFSVSAKIATIRAVKQPVTGYPVFFFRRSCMMENTGKFWGEKMSLTYFVKGNHFVIFSFLFQPFLKLDRALNVRNLHQTAVGLFRFAGIYFCFCLPQAARITDLWGKGEKKWRLEYFTYISTIVAVCFLHIFTTSYKVPLSLVVFRLLISTGFRMQVLYMTSGIQTCFYM